MVLELDLGEVLRELEWGGICFGGERHIVGFKIDFTNGATADCTIIALLALKAQP